MAGNVFGEIFRVMTFGESHGPAIGCVIDGVPPGLELSTGDIQKDLDRRRPGQSEVTTRRDEGDTVEILSGVFEGRTTGTSLALLIRNSDQRSQDYAALKDVFRPGHADQAYYQKFGIRDYRGGGRSSGRETAARVAAGAVAKKMLAVRGIKVLAYTLAVSDVRASTIDLDVIEQNMVRAPELKAAEEMVGRIKDAQSRGDSLGGIIETVVLGCPAGLGDPVFDKLDARLSHAMMSIGAVKGIEFGAGFAVAQMPGSVNNDELAIDNGRIKTRHNFAGGISGGISSGEPIVFRMAVKPTSSISIKQTAATIEGHLSEIEIQGRHDPCLCPRIVPVVEAMAALVLADAILIQQSIH
ncbi:MAG: chorismate synthase [Candidatus Omnitrophica bacterium]|nr:chorismate synthase [Candidatus Omnitrophota bacterium]